MAVILDYTAPNYATGDYHRILKLQFLCAPGETIEPRWEIHVGFYASEEARANNPANPMWYNVVTIPLSQLPTDPRVDFYDMLMNSPLFAGTNAQSDETVQPAS